MPLRLKRAIASVAISCRGMVALSHFLFFIGCNLHYAADLALYLCLAKLVPCEYGPSTYFAHSFSPFQASVLGSGPALSGIFRGNIYMFHLLTRDQL